MPRASLSTKGQLVIPKAIREHLGLRPGHGVDFVLVDNGDVLVRAAVEDVRALKGCLQPRGRKPVTIEEMSRAIRQRGKGGAMTGLDTNVLVRYITQDEPKQAAAASRANRAAGAGTTLTFDKALRDTTHFSIVRAAWHRKGR